MLPCCIVDVLINAVILRGRECMMHVVVLVRILYDAHAPETPLTGSSLLAEKQSCLFSLANGGGLTNIGS